MCQSAREVYLPSRSPRPAAIMAGGAAHRVGKSAKTAAGGWAGTGYLYFPTTIGATIEVYPSTEGAVGREMNISRERWLIKRVISVTVPEPTAIKERSSPRVSTSA